MAKSPVGAPWRAAVASAALLAAAPPAPAAPLGASTDGLGLKPGLWQVAITYQSVNGRQVLDSHYLLARLLQSVDPTDLALDRVNVALAQNADPSFASHLNRADIAHSNLIAEGGLPNQMRMRAEASTNENGADMGATASFRICLTSAAARLDAPILDEGNRCRPTRVTRDSRHVHFQFSCHNNGTAITGRADSHRSMFGHVMTVADMTVTLNEKTHLAVHDRMDMKFVSAACGALKPPTP